MKVNKRRASEGGREGGGEAGLPGAGHGAQLRMMGIADWTRKPEASSKRIWLDKGGGGEAGLPGAQLRMMGIAGWTREPKAKLAGQGSCERFI